MGSGSKSIFGKVQVMTSTVNRELDHAEKHQDIMATHIGGNW